jgi:hypothetical protein
VVRCRNPNRDLRENRARNVVLAAVWFRWRRDRLGSSKQRHCARRRRFVSLLGRLSAYSGPLRRPLGLLRHLEPCVRLLCIPPRSLYSLPYLFGEPIFGIQPRLSLDRSPFGSSSIVQLAPLASASRPDAEADDVIVSPREMCPAAG